MIRWQIMRFNCIF